MKLQKTAQGMRLTTDIRVDLDHVLKVRVRIKDTAFEDNDATIYLEQHEALQLAETLIAMARGLKP